MCLHDVTHTEAMCTEPNTGTQVLFNDGKKHARWPTEVENSLRMKQNVLVKL